MSKKIDEQFPNTVGKGVLPDYPAVATPWGRLFPIMKQPSIPKEILQCTVQI